jgi:hypothetical protein
MSNQVFLEPFDRAAIQLEGHVTLYVKREMNAVTDVIGWLGHRNMSTTE